MAGLTDAGARSVLETLTWQRARIAELEAALSDLHNECEHAGHDRDLDYGWPRVMAAAKSALNK